MSGEVGGDRCDARSRGPHGGHPSQQVLRVRRLEIDRKRGRVGSHAPADAGQLVLRQQVLVEICPSPATDRTEHRPQPQALPPSGDEAEDAPSERGGEQTRPSPSRVEDPCLALRIDAQDHLVEDDVARFVEERIDLAAHLRCPRRAVEARKQNAELLTSRRSAHCRRGGLVGAHPDWCSNPAWTDGISSWVRTSVVT